MKYNEIEQYNEVKDSNQDVIESDCVGEGCFVKVPIEDLQNRVLFSEPQAIYYCLKNRLNVINSKKKEKTDVVEMSCREIMYVVGGDKKNFTRNRQKLIEAGLIDVLKQAKNQNEKTLYRVRSRQNDVSGSRQNDVSGSRQNDVSGSRQNDVSGSRQNDVSDSEKNPSNSLENSTLQSSDFEGKNIYKEYNKNKPLNTYSTKYLASKVLEDKKENNKKNPLIYIEHRPSTLEPSIISTNNNEQKEDKMSKDDLFSAQALSNNVAPSAPKNNRTEIEEKVLRFCFKDYPYDHYIPKKTVAEWLKDFAPLSEALKKAVRKHNLTARGIERYGKWNANDIYECNLNLVDRIADDIAEVYYAPIPKTQSNLTKEESKLYEEILLASSDKAGLRYREYAERYPTEWRKAIYQLRRDYNNGETEHYYVSML